MRKGRDRIVIDTNTLISFFLIRKSARLDSLIANGKILMLFSEELLNEFLTVIQRAKFKKYFSAGDIESLILMIRNRAQLVEVTSKVLICRDPKDNFLLALAQDGKADYLLTGDKDLLSLKKFKKTRILSLSDYLKS